MAASWDPAAAESAARDRRARGVRRRPALDLRADGRHRPRSALGPDRRGRRRGPVPRLRDGRGAGARLPGRRPRRARHDHGHRQAFRRLRRGRGRARLCRRRHLRAHAARGLPAALRGRRAGRRGSFMAAFNAVDGVPTTAIAALLRGMLRDDWGCDGVLVSDWRASPSCRRTASPPAAPRRRGWRSRPGVDMDMVERPLRAGAGGAGRGRSGADARGSTRPCGGSSRPRATSACSTIPTGAATRRARPR